MTVHMNELRRACLSVLEFIERERGTDFDLVTDYYWRPVGFLDLDVKPHEFTMGQTSEDVASLEDVTRGARPANYVDVEHLAGLLSVLAAERPARPKP